MSDEREDRLPEPFAQRICQQAIEEGRAADMLHCLFDGGSVTIDLTTGALVLLSVRALQEATDDH